MNPKPNGEFYCSLGPDMKYKLDSAMEKIDEIYSTHQLIGENIQHLEKLDIIADTLIGLVSGKDQFPMKVGMKVINTLCFVIVALIIVIGCLLTGEHFGWIEKLLH